MAAAASLMSSSTLIPRLSTKLLTFPSSLSSSSSSSRSMAFSTPVKGLDRLRRFSSSTPIDPAPPVTKESPSNNPGLTTDLDSATKGFFLQQTMYRISNPEATLDFYSRVLGMSLLKRLDFPEMKVTLFFVGYEDTACAPADPVDRSVWAFSQKATIELTYGWGTETDPNFTGFHNGNTAPLGYGHVGITVPDGKKAFERFDKLGVEYAERPDEGPMKGIAFIKDPDGYFIEIFDLNTIREVTTPAS